MVDKHISETRCLIMRRGLGVGGGVVVENKFVCLGEKFDFRVYIVAGKFCCARKCSRRVVLVSYFLISIFS